MRESFEMYKKEFNELKQIALQAVISSGIDNIDEDGFKALLSMLRLCDTAMKMNEAQIDALERIEQKLDKLLAK